MNGINSINNLIQEVSNDLITHGHDDVVKMLNQYAEELNTDTGRIQALEEIIGLCGIKSMGDLNMPSYSGWQWQNKIENLSRKCRKILKLL